MVIAIGLQLKNVIKDKLVLMSMLLPIVLVAILRIYTPNTIIDNQIVLIDNNVPNITMEKLNKVTNIVVVKNKDQLYEKVLHTKDDIIGIIMSDDTEEYEFIIQGNETTRVKTFIEVVATYLNREEDVSSFKNLILPHKSTDMYNFIVVLIILIALFMGCTYNGFNIVAEKEEGIQYINQILPMTEKMYMIQKIMLGCIGSIIITMITLLIAVTKIYWISVIILTIISSFLASMIGFYLGTLSKNLMSVIINTKVILLVFIFIPVINFMMPYKSPLVKGIFYLVPSFSIFNGLWIIIAEYNFEKLIYNIAIIIAHSVLLVVINKYVKFNKHRCY